jgi:SLT domain-containing protein
MAGKEKSSTNITGIKKLDNEAHAFIAYRRRTTHFSDQYINSDTTDYMCQDHTQFYRYQVLLNPKPF